MSDTSNQAEAVSWQERLAQSHLAICRDYERRLEIARNALEFYAEFDEANTVSAARAALAEIGPIPPRPDARKDER